MALPLRFRSTSEVAVSLSRKTRLVCSQARLHPGLMSDIIWGSDTVDGPLRRSSARKDDSQNATLVQLKHEKSRTEICMQASSVTSRWSPSQIIRTYRPPCCNRLWFPSILLHALKDNSANQYQKNTIELTSRAKKKKNTTSTASVNSKE